MSSNYQYLMNCWVSIDKPVGKFVPTSHTYALNIHWNGRKPASVMVNGKTVNWMLNGDMLSLKTGLSNQESINIIVK
jgi:hypothetical protein